MNKLNRAGAGLSRDSRKESYDYGAEREVPSSQLPYEILVIHILHIAGYSQQQRNFGARGDTDIAPPAYMISREVSENVADLLYCSCDSMCQQTYSITAMMNDAELCTKIVPSITNSTMLLLHIT